MNDIPRLYEAGTLRVKQVSQTDTKTENTPRDYMCTGDRSSYPPRLATAGHGWPRLAPAGPGWPRLAPAGHGWRRLAPAGAGWRRLATAGAGWRRLGSAGSAGAGWRRLAPADTAQTVQIGPNRSKSGQNEHLATANLDPSWETLFSSCLLHKQASTQSKIRAPPYHFWCTFCSRLPRLATSGAGWRRLATADAGWRRLATAGDGWRRLAPAPCWLSML